MNVTETKTKSIRAEVTVESDQIIQEILAHRLLRGEKLNKQQFLTYFVEKYAPIELKQYTA